LLVLADVDSFSDISGFYFLLFFVELHAEGVLLSGVFFDKVCVLVEAHAQVFTHLF